MSFVNPDSIHRPADGTIAPSAWGDTINDDLNYLAGQVSTLNTNLTAANSSIAAATSNDLALYWMG
jgi:hypothetical protein